MASIHGALTKVPVLGSKYESATYKWQGAILRAVKAALAAGIGVILAAQLAGTLLPEDSEPMVILAVTVILQGADKFIREWKVEEEIPPTDNPSGE